MKYVYFYVTLEMTNVVLKRFSLGSLLAASARLQLTAYMTFTLNMEPVRQTNVVCKVLRTPLWRQLLCISLSTLFHSIMKLDTGATVSVMS